jgi:regulator of sigma E protease
MNVLLAFALTALVLIQGVDIPIYEDQPPVIGTVIHGSVAEKADVRTGDLIVSVAGHHVSTWEQFLVAIGSRPGRETPIEIERHGRHLPKVVTPTSQPNQSNFEIGDMGVLPNVHPHLLQISSGEPAEKAGLQSGDVILAVDGEPINFSVQLRDAIAKHPEVPIRITILRDEVRQDITVAPARSGGIGRLGVGISDAIKSLKPGPIGAVRISVERNIEATRLIFQTLWGLITRETSAKQLMGPVAIAQLSGESAQLGWIALFNLMASLSLNLGLLNLLPIPVLDGGHIFIMALEGVARRDFSIRVKEKMLLAGFVVLMMLMVTVIYNDLTRITWIERLMPWR